MVDLSMLWPWFSKNRRVVRKIFKPKVQDSSTVHICDDIMIDILSRLPTADLCQWKCVSKHWRLSVIPSILAQRPNVLAFFGSRCSNKPSFLSIHNDGTVHDHYPHHSSLSGVYNDQYLPQLDILCVCNGAILFTLPSHMAGVKNYAVYNPFNHQTSIIQRPPHSLERRDLRLLAFDPRISSHNFKVVSHFYNEQPLVYCSRTKKWRPFKLPPLHFIYSRKRSQNRRNLISLQNLASDYCIGSKCVSYCINQRAYKIVSDYDALQEVVVFFDVKAEGLKCILCPKRNRNEIFYFGETAGRICYAKCDSRSMSLIVWALTADCTWIMRHNVELQTIDGLKFCFHPLDDETLFVTDESNIVRFYKFKRSELCEIVKIRTPGKSYYSHYFYPYLSPH